MTEGSNSFFDTPKANPKHIEDQRRVLDYLKVGSVVEVLPQEINEFYTQNKKDQKASLKIPDGTLKLTQLREGLFMVRKLQPRKADGKFPIDADRIIEYFMIDDKHGTAWDVSQLWKESITGAVNNQPEIVTSSDLLVKLGFRAGYYPDKNLIHIDSPTDTFLRKIFDKINHLDDKSSFIVDILTTPHETGHRYQFKPNEKNALSGKYKLLMYVLNSFPILGKVINKLPIVGKGMKHERNMTSDVERNANAFAVAVIHKLREHNFDLLPGISNSEMLGVVENHFLEGYEKPFKYIDGKGISQAKRHNRNTITLQQIAEDKQTEGDEK